MNFTAYLYRQRLDTFLPTREREVLEKVVGERLKAARTTAPQRIFAQTNPITQSRVYEGGFSFNGGLGGII